MRALITLELIDDNGDRTGTVFADDMSEKDIRSSSLRQQVIDDLCSSLMKMFDNPVKRS